MKGHFEIRIPKTSPAMPVLSIESPTFSDISDEFMFRPITEEEFFDAVEEELDKRDQMEQESNESNRLKQQAAGQQAVTPNEHHSQSVGLDFKIRVSILYLGFPPDL